MRYFIVFAFLIAAIHSGCSEDKNARFVEENEFHNRLNVISFNIRYSPDDGINAWENRRKMATDVFTDYNIDVAGLQEVTDVQVPDLEELLPEYAYFGEKSRGGEYCPIFYKKDKFELMDYGTQWLSESPEIVGSIGWDGKYPRIFTWGKFKNVSTDSIFYFFNTHFDHVGTIAKRESAKLILDKLEEIAGNNPAIITGDFNFSKDDSYYDIMISSQNVVRVKDTKEDSVNPYTGIESSFNGFGNSKMLIIDFIFVTQGIQTQRYDILKIRDGDVFISDHYPVYSELAF